MTIFVGLAVVVAAATISGHAVTAPGPLAPLSGTMIDAGRGRPVVLIIPGSGPTDRDGNSPLGITAAPYRLLAEALAAKGVSSVRSDKRGMFGSKTAVADANAVTIGNYVSDVASWVGAVHKASGAKCVWLVGHSEGGLIALAAAQRAAGLCGVVLVAAPGVPLGQTLRAQLRANPANAPLLPDAFRILDSLQAGVKVDVASTAPPLQRLFAPRVQGYLIELLKQRPAAMAGAVTLPLLIVAGTTDLQVPVSDAEALAKVQPLARLAVITGMNHVLKAAPADRAGNFATYGDPSLPVVPALVEAIAGFVSARR